MKRFCLAILFVLAEASLSAVDTAVDTVRLSIPFLSFNLTQLETVDSGRTAVEQATRLCITNMETITMMTDARLLLIRLESMHLDFLRDEFLGYMEAEEDRTDGLLAWERELLQVGEDEFYIGPTGRTFHDYHAVRGRLAVRTVEITPFSLKGNAVVVRIDSAAKTEGSGAGTEVIPLLPSVRIDPFIPENFARLCEYQILVLAESAGTLKKEIVVRTLQKEIISEVLRLFGDTEPRVLPYLGFLAYTLVNDEQDALEIIIEGLCR